MAMRRAKKAAGSTVPAGGSGGASAVPSDTDLPKPVTRPLKAYAFDPSAGKLLGNEMTMKVRYQNLDPGPVVLDRHHSDAIAVVDYDGANQTYYHPVDLDDPRILIRSGLDPAEGDPRFHQQMVYAVVTDTIQHFEQALGRRIHWRRGNREDNPNANLEDIWTLLLYPHAFIGPNAFYSPDAHGILFGYFRAEAENVGRNLPGQTVFCCLSHDVLVHETTHAVIDGIRTFFTEQTNPDVPAFHEAIADLAALFRHFTHGEVLRDTLEKTGGALFKEQMRPDVSPDQRSDGKNGPLLSSQASQENPLIALAQQFGEATGKQRALRSALGKRATPEDIKKVVEPHDRGSILVAAVFDAFFSIFMKRTADLWRIFRAGGGSDNPTDIPKPLSDRLCDEAVRLSEQFFQICVRALDYCPPVDITFGTYLRAVITADLDLRPNDDIGMRDALMQSFRMRGIFPDRAGFFSEGAIAWQRAESAGLPPVTGLDFGDANGLTNQQKDTVRGVLDQYLEKPLAADKAVKVRDKIGFEPNLPISIPSFHPVFRINPDGSLRTDMVVEMVQTRQVPFNVEAPRLGTFALRGGVTLIIQKPTADEVADGGDASVRYVISRHLHGLEGRDRENRQRQYGERIGLAEGNDPNRFKVNFAMVHGV
jgi:hypothetical protein